MSRPQKKREICCLPKCNKFSPINQSDKKVILSLDQFETIRLIDYEKLTQEECSLEMKVARTTVQSIYDEARAIIADAIINSKHLIIEGGNVNLCDNEKNCESCNRECPKRIVRNTNFKENNNMIIAATYENGQIFQHFGHTKQFKIYEIEDKQIKSFKVINTNGSGHSALSGFLKNLNVNILVCGGIGSGAINALNALGIEIYGGVIGDSDTIIHSLINGILIQDNKANCDHHNHGEKKHLQHKCGEHSCK